MDYLSTGLVAQLLSVETHRLGYLTRDRQIRPAKGPTGAFLWSYADVCQAAAALDLPPPSPEDFRARAQISLESGSGAEGETG